MVYTTMTIDINADVSNIDVEFTPGATQQELL
jgi:hypothetical protein